MVCIFFRYRPFILQNDGNKRNTNNQKEKQGNGDDDTHTHKKKEFGELSKGTHSTERKCGYEKISIFLSQTA